MVLALTAINVLGVRQAAIAGDVFTSGQAPADASFSLRSVFFFLTRTRLH